MTASYLAALSAVAGLAVICIAALRLLKGRGLSLLSENPIAVIAQRSIGNGGNLVIVEVGGCRLLLGVSRAGLQLVHALPQKASADVLPFDTSFSAVLKRARR